MVLKMVETDENTCLIYHSLNTYLDNGKVDH